MSLFVLLLFTHISIFVFLLLFLFSQCPEVQMPDSLSVSQIIASDSILNWWHCMWDSTALHCRMPSEGFIVLKQNFISRVLF